MWRDSILEKQIMQIYFFDQLEGLKRMTSVEPGPYIQLLADKD